MITITLGTNPYPFMRVIAWLKVLIDKKIINEPIFLQYGATDIGAVRDYKLVAAVSLLPYGDLLEKIKASRLVIAHAGEGSTRKLAPLNTSFVILPRLSEKGEHVDNHQSDFSQAVKTLGITVCHTIQDLELAILNPPQPLNKELISGPKLVDFLSKQYPPTGVSVANSYQ